MTTGKHLVRKWVRLFVLGLTPICAHVSSAAAPPGGPSLAVATIDPRTHVATVRSGVLKQTFSNGVRIASAEIVKSGTRYYLVRTAANRGKCQTVATPLQAVKGSLVLARRGGGGFQSSSSCFGDPCSSCKFVFNPDDVPTGCSCNDAQPGHKCNHTITTPTVGEILQ